MNTTTGSYAPDNSHEFGDEFCPSCGYWKPLIEDTGWCLTCTLRHQPGILICEQCEKVFKNNDGQHRRICKSCHETSWQERNADAIERYMACGLSFELAYIRVQINSRPICLSCGNRIKHGTKGIHLFCRSNVRCRTAARSYRWQRDHYGATREQAIQMVLSSLEKEDGT